MYLLNVAETVGHQGRKMYSR